MKFINPYNTDTQNYRILEILSDLNWHCSDCELPGSQPAKALQRIRQDGFELEKVGSNWAKTMYCKTCGRNTAHRRLVSLERKAEAITRTNISTTLRKRIIKLFNGEDAILGYAPTGRAIEIDHRIPEIRWTESEKDINEYATDKELKNRYMLLVREHNLLKSRSCEKCKSTGIRQPFIGIHYFYSGDEEYNGTCIGCGWYDPETWRTKLNLLLNS